MSPRTATLLSALRAASAIRGVGAGQPAEPAQHRQWHILPGAHPRMKRRPFLLSSDRNAIPDSTRCPGCGGTYRAPNKVSEPADRRSTRTTVRRKRVRPDRPARRGRTTHRLGVRVTSFSGRWPHSALARRIPWLGARLQQPGGRQPRARVLARGTVGPRRILRQWPERIVMLTGVRRATEHHPPVGTAR